VALRLSSDGPVRELSGHVALLPGGELLLRLSGSSLGVTPVSAAAASFMEELEATLLDRQQSTAQKSYTKSLLEKGAQKIGEKLREEAGELSQALEVESDERVSSEAADVIYHLMVGLRLRNRSWREVVSVLASRMGRSGHEEKASRAK
jgi:phosphoribosyl-ATP pyrophosphohydrolase/phosphoribosyl-AMP cyclohydrolase